MITSWDDVFKYSWTTPEDNTFFPYEKDGWLYYYFEGSPTDHRKGLYLGDNRWDFFNNFRRGGPNPLYQEFTGPMQVPLSPIILKIRQMEQRRQHACRI